MLQHDVDDAILIGHPLYSRLFLLLLLLSTARIDGNSSGLWTRFRNWTSF